MGWDPIEILSRSSGFLESTHRATAIRRRQARTRGGPLRPTRGTGATRSLPPRQASMARTHALPDKTDAVADFPVRLSSVFSFNFQDLR